MSEITKLDQNLILKKIDKETINIQINNNEILMSIVGQYDQNLKDLSKLTKTEIFFRGNSITCKGTKDITISFSFNALIYSDCFSDLAITDFRGVLISCLNDFILELSNSIFLFTESNISSFSIIFVKKYLFTKNFIASENKLIF